MSTGPISVDTPDTPGTPNNGAEAVGSIDGLDASRRRRFTQRQMRWILPFAVLGAGMLFSALLHYTSPTPVEKEPVDVVPLVRVQAAVAKAVRLNVTAHGVVTPRTESDVVAEVRGRIVSVSPSLVAGGFFAEGDELKMMLMGMRRFTKVEPFNCKEARRRIAGACIDKNEYCF